MKVRALLFSRIREIVGESSVDLTLPDGAAAGDLLENLIRTYPKLSDFEGSVLFGIGVEFVERTYKLKDGDEIAIMPPVQGG